MSFGSLRIVGGAGEAHDHGSSCGTENVHISPEGAQVSAADYAGNVAIVTLGCAKNQVDSEVMLGAFAQKGFQVVSELPLADVIVVNTCGFLQSAVEEGVDRILEAAEFKKTGRCRKLIVAGCMVERYRDKLLAEFPEVDRFLSTDELLKVANDEITSDDCLSEARRPYFLYDELMPRALSDAGSSAYLKISEGCDRPCTFCIIPKIRGSFRSRKPESVIAEARNLLASGVREINLVGQDLTAYGADFAGPGKASVSTGDSGLLSLLEMLGNLQSVDPYWVRLLYAYPVGVTERLVQMLQENTSICSYLDLPLQHISSAVLKRMQRPLGARGTRGLIENIRRQAPAVALRTTFIVGFPGETDEDVEELLQFINEGHFMHVGIFTYSQEEEAKAFTFDQQVDEDVKEERRAMLMEAQQAVVERRLEEYVGKRLRVLVEGTHEESDLLLVGRSEFQAPETDGVVIINEIAEELEQGEDGSGSPDFSGRFCEVEVTEVAGYDLVATIVG
ncbi:MAG: 30S ribosomal protein S12 methylthiotransferase RimO [bacterium]|nr:30S ribosomal protein S12 methylthiotransferase RimO [bacterium]